MTSSISGASTSTAATAAQTSPTVTAPGGNMGKDEFLQLLVTQMRNQDPMDPMKGEEFAAQLAQFSSLEQLIGIQDQLKTQGTLSQSLLGGMNAQSAMAALGHTVTAQGNQVVVPESGDASVTLDVGGNGGAAKLHVYDASGREVGTRDLGDLAAGRQTVELGSAASGLKPGAYTYKVEVADPKGQAVAVQTYTIGRVDGVLYGQDGPVLTSGGMKISLGTVVSVAQD